MKEIFDFLRLILNHILKINIVDLLLFGLIVASLVGVYIGRVLLYRTWKINRLELTND
jgi:pilus assembly protein TadC